MLFEAFLGWLGSILAWLGGLVALPEPPAFLGEGAAQLHTIVEQSAGLCRFVDFTLWPQAIWLVIGVWLIGFGIRVARVVLGFFVG